MTEHVCPDCAASANDDQRLQHEETCPTARNLEALMASDETALGELFAIMRPVADVEVVEHRIAGLISDHQGLIGDVCVLRIGPGIRGRDFTACFIVPRES